MNVLLDTNAFIYASWAPLRLSNRARDVILAQDNRPYISAIVVWECATKAATGKFEFDPDIQSWVRKQIHALGLSVLPVELSHCYMYHQLPFSRDHRDPFDRMLIAQALAEGIPLVSGDPAMRRYGVEVLW
jgi:PIN domain nuclease of toxin-antitoxin system